MSFLTIANQSSQEMNKEGVADDQDDLGAEECAAHHGKEGKGEVQAGDDQGPSLEGGKTTK